VLSFVVTDLDFRHNVVMVLDDDAARLEAGAPRGARAIARSELTRAIIASARSQLAEIGPGQLSVRAIARELGMASSAVYRYFPSRDELLTALLVITYNELGDLVEQAEAGVRRRADFRGRWLAVAHAFRGWAVAHPQDFALLYGSPVPGYAAPRTTVEPAMRITQLVVRLLSDVQASGAAPEPTQAVSRAGHRSLAGFREFAGFEVTDDLALRGLLAWGGLIGALTLELFGHLANGVTDFDAYFDEVARRLSPV